MAQSCFLVDVPRSCYDVIVVDVLQSSPPISSVVLSFFIVGLLEFVTVDSSNSSGRPSCLCFTLQLQLVLFITI